MQSANLLVTKFTQYTIFAKNFSKTILVFKLLFIYRNYIFSLHIRVAASSQKEFFWGGGEFGVFYGGVNTNT